MASNNMLLIKTFLKSTDEVNVLRFSNDKAKRKYAKNTLIGHVILYVMFMLYAIMLSVGLANFGQAEAISQICAMILLVVPFVFTLFKSNGYLFGFKEYDMIMAMPFTVKSIINGKFWYMYIKSIPMFGIMSLAMLAVFSVGGHLTLWSCIQWVVMTFSLPIIPMVIASLLGAVAVIIGTGFKYKNIVQAVVITILILPLFFIRFFIENTIRGDNLDDMMYVLSDSITGTVSHIPLAKSFSKAVNEGSILSFLLVIVSAIVTYELFVVLLSKFYRRINSKLSTGIKNKKYEFTSQKQMSMAKAIAFKEFKRMTGSSTYLINAGLGQVMVTVMGIAMLFVKPEVIIESMMQGAPIEPSLVFPAIPLLLYFFIGMMPTTACSPSLEGKNYWIMQTLPISHMDDIKGKILYNLYLSIPVSVFATIAGCVCFRVSVIDAIMSVIAISSLCIFSTVSGLRSGLKHRRLDWENEIEVIKQGMAVTSYIIPHIVSGILLMPLVVYANYYLHNVTAIMLLLTLIALLLTELAWKGVRKVY